VIRRAVLSIVAVAILAGNAVTVFAGAGMIGDVECCCPDPDKCPCHDHDDQAPREAKLKTCSTDATLVVATPLVAVASTTAPAIEERPAPRVVAAPEPIPDDVPTEIETPPF
jgi:hypothetical protein